MCCQHYPVFDYNRQCPVWTSYPVPIESYFPHVICQVSWTQLTETAVSQIGSTVLHLESQEALGWHKGDTLVIASTDFDMEQAELVRVIIYC